MGDDSCLRGRGFESRSHKLDGHDKFWLWFVVKIVLFVFGVVAQLVDKSLSTSEVCSSNPDIGIIFISYGYSQLYWKKEKKKSPEMAHFRKKTHFEFYRSSFTYLVRSLDLFWSTPFTSVPDGFTRSTRTALSFTTLPSSEATPSKLRWWNLKQVKKTQ